jgi:hypothetical protein
MYKNRRMKSDKIVYKRRGGKGERVIEGVTSQ